MLFDRGMLTKIVAITALAFTACVDNAGPTAVGAPNQDLVGTVGATAMPPTDPNRAVTQHSLVADGTDACDMLPPDGPCAAACDPVALQAFIPAGTCVLIDCTLTDGSTIKIGGCN
jgi:hypothetical protein